MWIQKLLGHKYFAVQKRIQSAEPWSSYKPFIDFYFISVSLYSPLVTSSNNVLEADKAATDEEISCYSYVNVSIWLCKQTRFSCKAFVTRCFYEQRDFVLHNSAFHYFILYKELLSMLFDNKHVYYRNCV